MEIFPDFSKFFKKNTGFLMIDAIVAVVIVSVALVALSYLYTQGTKASVMAGSSERAMEIAAQRIEFLKKGAGISYSADDGLAALVAAANSDKVVKLDGEAREYGRKCCKSC
jgi:type II secretory pathway pseudopilin PulG